MTDDTAMTASVPSHEYVRVRGALELHVIVWQPSQPGGRAILLVHGLASNARMWDGVATRLAGHGHPVAAIDLRGHGLSGKPNPAPRPPAEDTVYDFATVCLDIDQVVAHLAGSSPAVDKHEAAQPRAWERPVIAGQSYGANVALELGSSRPWAYSGVVCVDGGTIELSESYPDWDTCAGALAPPHFAEVEPEDMQKMVRDVHPDWPETGIQGMLGNFIVDSRGFVEPCLGLDRHMTILHHLWSHHPVSLYRNLSVPVVLVPAEGKGAVSLDARKKGAETALRYIPKARLHWMTGDHDLHAQHPGEIADLIHEEIASGFFE